MQVVITFLAHYRGAMVRAGNWLAAARVSYREAGAVSACMQRNPADIYVCCRQGTGLLARNEAAFLGLPLGKWCMQRRSRHGFTNTCEDLNSRTGSINNLQAQCSGFLGCNRYKEVHTRAPLHQQSPIPCVVQQVASHEQIKAPKP